MGQARPKWRQVRSYFTKRGFTIYHKGGDGFIKAPQSFASRGKCPIVKIGHKYCCSAGAELLPCYCKKIERTFGVTIDEILNG